MNPPARNGLPGLADAMALLQQGDAIRADAAFAALLKRHPRHFDVVHLSGVAAVMAGRTEEGATRIRRAIGINPKNAAAHGNLGSALIRLGRQADALNSLDRAVALDPTYADGHANRGTVLLNLRRLDEAIAALDRAIALRPDNAEAHNDRGCALMDQQKPDEALASHEKALSLRPKAPSYLINMGLVLCALQRAAEALNVFDNALQVSPGNASAIMGRTQALLALGRPQEGLACIDALIAVQPQLAQAYLWRANALVLLGQPEAALQASETARSLAPQNAAMHNNYGYVLGHLNRLEEALDAYDEALRLQPKDVDTLWNRALALLVLGRFEEGWLAYEHRNLRRKTLAARKYPKPLWWGREPIKGQKLYIYWEQGLGDTIQFARYALLAAAQGAEVVLSVQDPLRRLFNCFAPYVSIIGQNEEPPEFDLHCPLMTMPLACGTGLETIPAWPRGYLEVSPEEVTPWAESLPRARRRIGLVWSGNQSHANDANRSVSFAKLAPLLQADAGWISLQKEIREADRPAFEAAGIADFSDRIKDFADTAALISTLDLVITVDTSVAHLAGALGKPVWVMVTFSPDFRWLLNREDSPWYPSMRLFRQESPGDWDGVIARVKAALGG